MGKGSAGLLLFLCWTARCEGLEGRFLAWRPREWCVLCMKINVYVYNSACIHIYMYYYRHI